MKYPDNIADLMKLPVDMMGLIFYPRSPRYIGDEEVFIEKAETQAKRVGVFVNEETKIIEQKVMQYHLDYVQLHGNESVQTCRGLNSLIPVIKAFSISDQSDFAQTKDYEGACRFFLFDTKTTNYGGSGRKFDWGILDNYDGKTPFLLSGGITAEDVQVIKEIKHPMLYGIDLNSRFEVTPGLKNINLLEQFIKEIKS